MRRYSVYRYKIRRPYTFGDIVYSDTYSLLECYSLINLKRYGVTKKYKEVKSYKSSKALKHYIIKNKIDLHEKITLEVK